MRTWSARKGFTLIETLITTVVLVSGLLAVATLFSYSIRTNLISRQRTTATILLYEKMEQFTYTPLTDVLWAADASDQVTIPEDGTYKRLWKITGTMPRSVTIIVYARGRELARATTLVSR